jgi:hypothetical protein
MMEFFFFLSDLIMNNLILYSCWPKKEKLLKVPFFHPGFPFNKLYLNGEIASLLWHCYE